MKRYAPGGHFIGYGYGPMPPRKNGRRNPPLPHGAWWSGNHNQWFASHSEAVTNGMQLGRPFKIESNDTGAIEKYDANGNRVHGSERRNPNGGEIDRDPHWLGLYRAVQRADDEYEKRIVQVYGRRGAGDARYKKHTDHELLRLRGRKIAAEDAFKAYSALQRNGHRNPPHGYESAVRKGMIAGASYARKHPGKVYDRSYKYEAVRQAHVLYPGKRYKDDNSPSGYSHEPDPLTTVFSIAFEDGVNKVSGKRNPEPAAADMYETFHGKPSTETLEYVEEHHYHEHLAELGDLTEMKVATVTGLDITVSFDGAGTKLSCNETGNQLYFVGGDQSIDLDGFKMNTDEWLKDHMLLGILYQVTYRTEKGFDEFQLTDYYHDVGEETGVQPVLLYDTLNQTLSVAGGQYQVKDVGIVN
jgi:hypothetical protein